MNNKNLEIPAKAKRAFLPEFFVIDSWEKLLPYFENLKSREIHSVENLEQWLKDKSELEAVLEEDLAWRYIKMNIDTNDKTLAESFTFFVSEIEPKTAPWFNDYNKMLVENEFTSQLKDPAYQIYLKQVQKSIDIFREENIPLKAELQQMEQEFGAITGNILVHFDGKELTLPQASIYLKNKDRKIREEVYHLIGEKRLAVSQQLDELLNKLIALRQQIATNAGYENFRDYKFDEMCRFDYTKSDCFNFHNAIQEELIQILSENDSERKSLMQLQSLKPWDTQADVLGREPLKPFNSGEELLNKTIEMFYAIDSYFGDCLAIMQKMGHLDLESKKGKAPGGFNYPLYESGAPFIYMNSVGTVRDLVTLIHEGGHAVHSFLSHPLSLTAFKNLTPEIAEVASMSMELISLDYWDIIFSNKEELKRGKKEHLEDILSTLPWVATIDKFQHWLYENKNHTVAERTEAWNKIYNDFSSSEVDWKGLENLKSIVWQKQLHIYEVPFYYIEYGMAQLAAIAIWRNFKTDKEKAIQQYKAALTLGYTRSIPEIYETAGIQFNFSKEYIHELAEFVKAELKALG